MALEFHIANSDRDQKRYTGICFDEEVHDLLFCQVGLPKGRFSYFRRMEDYYGDARYHNDELKYLLGELKELEAIFGDNRTVISQLREIRRACQKATDKNMSIWVYCD